MVDFGLWSAVSGQAVRIGDVADHSKVLQFVQVFKWGNNEIIGKAQDEKDQEQRGDPGQGALHFFITRRPEEPKADMSG